MNLEEKVNKDIKIAMRAKDRRRLEALRSIKSAILLAKTQKGAKESLDESGEINLLQKIVKQRYESAEIYKQQNRSELFENEIYEADIIQAYLPKQMNDEDLRSTLETIIKETGAQSIKDMGIVMSEANRILKGQAQGKRIAELVKNLLNS